MGKRVHQIHGFPNEQRLADLIGEDLLAQACLQTMGFRHEIALLGTPYFVLDGMVIPYVAGGAFSSLSDLIAEASGGKQQTMFVQKSEAGTSAVGAHTSLWRLGNNPVAGADPSAIPGGTVPTNATAGSLRQADAGGGDTLHLVSAILQASVDAQLLLMYDRLFAASGVQHNSAADQTVSGTPTRYATTTSPGNFAFLEVTTVLTSAGNTITLTYTDQDGNAAEATAGLAKVTSAQVNRIPHTPWFIPLNSPDTGIRTVTKVKFTSADASGVSNIVQGHPLAMIPLPIANQASPMDAVNSAFNLARILDGACLAFLLLYKSATTAVNVNGQIVLVSG